MKEPAGTAEPGHHTRIGSRISGEGRRRRRDRGYPRGSSHSRPSKRAKSPSVEQRSPCSMARAATCATARASPRAPAPLSRPPPVPLPHSRRRHLPPLRRGPVPLGPREGAPSGGTRSRPPKNAAGTRTLRPVPSTSDRRMARPMARCRPPDRVSSWRSPRCGAVTSTETRAWSEGAAPRETSSCIPINLPDYVRSSACDRGCQGIVASWERGHPCPRAVRAGEAPSPWHGRSRPRGGWSAVLRVGTRGQGCPRSQEGTVRRLRIVRNQVNLWLSKRADFCNHSLESPVAARARPGRGGASTVNRLCWTKCQLIAPR